MRLIIGGCAQGKLTYALTDGEATVIDEASYEEFAVGSMQAENRVIVNHLHLIYRQLMEDGRNPEEWISQLIADCKRRGVHLTLIADELGNGIVPMERKDREYRENVGRLLCRLAAQADCVERVICQLPQRLK